MLLDVYHNKNEKMEYENIIYEIFGKENILLENVYQNGTGRMMVMFLIKTKKIQNQLD